MYYIDWFLYVEPSLHSMYKPHFSWCIILFNMLNLVWPHFLLDDCIIILQGYWFIIFFLSLVSGQCEGLTEVSYNPFYVCDVSFNGFSFISNFSYLNFLLFLSVSLRVCQFCLFFFFKKALLGTNLTKEMRELHTKNDTMLLKEVKGIFQV